MLYKMVVPKKLAGQLASGAARQMAAEDGGVYSAVRGAKSIVGTRGVPVAAGTGGGAATGAAAVGAGVSGVAIAAAPVVLLLAATAGRIYAEQERRAAVERVENTLNRLKSDALAEERDELKGAVSAITKATALLADEGRLGHSLVQLPGHLARGDHGRLRGQFVDEHPEGLRPQVHARTCPDLPMSERLTSAGVHDTEAADILELERDLRATRRPL